MADVTPEQAMWSPPGKANPLGASYAHVAFGEDMLVNLVLRGGATMVADGRETGASERHPPPGVDYGEWARRVQVDLPVLREYAKAVYQNTADYIDSLSDEDLEHTMELRMMGTQTVGWVLGNIILWHVNAHCGEISCLKGMQGARGYPF